MDQTKQIEILETLRDELIDNLAQALAIFTTVAMQSLNNETSKKAQYYYDCKLGKKVPNHSELPAIELWNWVNWKIVHLDYDSNHSHVRTEYFNILDSLLKLPPF